VLDRARPLVEILWRREIEAASLDTPERRAALEARIGELVRGIADEAVRKYYRQDFFDRLRNLTVSGSGQAQGGPARTPFSRPGRQERDSRPPWQRGRGSVQEAMAQPSARLASSPIVRGHRSALPPREALMLIAVINHPWLLEQFAEDFAALEFLNPETGRLRQAILDVVTGAPNSDSVQLRAKIAGKGLATVLARVEAAITHGSDWPVNPGVSPDDVGQWWTQIVALHRKQHTLNKELKDAERALGLEPTDTNLAWLCDVQSRLSALDGSEAQIEGFGSSSGRTSRGV
jgi:DNA primase